MNRGLILAALVASLTACTTTPKPNESDIFPAEPAVPETLPVFQDGVKALEQERYSEAAKIFDRLLVAKPATEYDLVTTYNSAAAHEGMGNCPKAGERYREVVRGSGGKFQRIESMAYFRLSLMYECLGQDAKAVTALIDARKRGRYLPFATLHAEIPARLAAAYSRLGNRQKALEYFAVANKGLKRIVSSESGRKQQDVLGQSLFLMGQLNPAQRNATGDPLAFLAGLSMQQPHLLQAVEINHAVWSKKAADDLELAYDNIWKYEFKDTALLAEYRTRALQVARELKKIRLPGEDVMVGQIFAKVDDTEKRLLAQLAQRPDQNPLTPEAEKREGLRREGRLVDPTPPAPKKKPPTKR